MLDKRENLIFIMVLLILIGVGIVIGWQIRDRLDNDVRREYVDSLFRESRKVITFDSIRSAIEKTMMDSIRDVRSDIERAIAEQRKNTSRHEINSARIRHRIDSIGPINRPDF